MFSKSSSSPPLKILHSLTVDSLGSLLQVKKERISSITPKTSDTKSNAPVAIPAIPDIIFCNAPIIAAIPDFKAAKKFATKVSTKHLGTLIT